MMPSRLRTETVLWAIGPLFALVAVWLFFFSPKAEIPLGVSRPVAHSDILRGAWRTPLMDARESIVDGIKRPCSECHRLFAPSQAENRTLMQHKEIVLRHGINARCLNCHDGADRDKLVLHNGALVGFDQAPLLCSQCHGTVFRDWQHGVHGKTMGSWDAASGAQRRLACNECHDPHSPAYRPMAPLAGPGTLRMGDQTPHESHAGRRSPLRQWSHGSPAHGDADPSGTSDEDKEDEP
ncbi:MAG: hypothetical protein JNK58_12135 [Phycisphaerae bacterium]|nr:hypothetical protein [Phycisphaerae bacterium]